MEGDPENFKTRGNQALKTGEFNEAIHFYTKAIELDDNNPIYFSNRVAAFIHAHRFEEAISDADRAIGIDSTFVKSYGRKGDALYHLGRYNEAIHAYGAGLGIEPDNSSLKAKEEQARKALKSGGKPHNASTVTQFLVGSKNAIVQTCVNVSRLAMLFCIIIYFVTPLSFGVQYFRMAVALCGLLNIWHTVQECGMPQFNQQYLQRIALTHSFHLAITTPMHMFGRPVALMLFPLGIFEMYYLALWVFRLAKFLNETVANKLHDYGLKIASSIIGVGNANELSARTLETRLASKLLHHSAVAQILVGFYLLLAVFTPAGSLMMLVFTWQLLQLQYMVLPHTKQAFHTVDTRIVSFLSHPYCPRIILTGYEKLRNYLHQMVMPTDPNAAPAAGGGGLAGMARRCAIM